MVANTLARRAAITGAGVSETGRKLERSGASLTAEASLAAIADAGLKPADIDGISSWPGHRPGFSGSSPVAVTELKHTLGLKLDWYSGGPEGPGQMASVINAAMAVATGQARHVLCFRTVKEGSARQANRSTTTVGGAAARIDDKYQWFLPYGAVSAATWAALGAQRHMLHYDISREQLAWVAINARRNAAMNPAALYTTPISMEEYMSARMISTPLCLYDCDVPMDGSAAVVVSRAEATEHALRPPLMIEAASGALHGPDAWDQREDYTTMAASDAAAKLWSQTEFKPEDVDIAQLYDGFSYFTLMWLEALGFCAPGESGHFVEGGERISLYGELPINTFGGQLSSGRLHGFGYLVEACEQLWHRAGERQAGTPNLGVVAVGGGPLASTLLLRRSRAR